MELDERARLAAAELRDAGHQARYTSRPPGALVRYRRAVAVAALALVALPMAWLWSRPATTVGSATSTTPESIETLVDAYVAALNSGDAPSLHGLSTTAAAYADLVFVLDSQGAPTGVATAAFDNPASYLAARGASLLEATAAPIQSGASVALPVRGVNTEHTLTGFVVLTVEEVESTFLIAGSVTILAVPEVELDDSATEVVESYIAAWNTGEAAEVLPFLANDATVWDSMQRANPTLAWRGDAVRMLITSSMWFTVETTGPMMTSGPFLAVPNRLQAPGDASEGLSVLLVDDGLILFHGFSQ
jgi:ketosteroid isomerase-like protein